MYQKITLIGRLTRDPEMRYTPGGKAVTNFSMATNNWKKEATWWSVTCWENTAEAVNQHKKRGDTVLVEGEMNTDNGNPKVFQKRDGTWAARFEITARTVQFIGGSGDREDARQSSDDEDIPPF